MEDRLVLYYSRSKQTVGFLAGIFLTAASVFIVVNGVENKDTFRIVVGIACVLLFGAASLAILGKLFGKRENVIIDRHGIHVLDWKCGLIPWEEIIDIWVERFRVRYYYRTRFVTFRVRNPDTYIRQLPPLAMIATKAGRSLGRGDKFSLSIDPYGVSVDAVWEHICRLKSSYQIPVSLRDEC
jgi:hypothetical protein